MLHFEGVTQMAFSNLHLYISYIHVFICFLAVLCVGAAASPLTPAYAAIML